jgi:hypothetical protein
MDDSQESDFMITQVVPSVASKRNGKSITHRVIPVDLSSQETSVEPLSSPPTLVKKSMNPVTDSPLAQSDSFTDSKDYFPFSPPPSKELGLKTTNNLPSKQELSSFSLHLNHPSLPFNEVAPAFETPSFHNRTPSPQLESKNMNFNPTVRPQADSTSSSDESLFSRPSPAKQQKSITTPVSTVLSPRKHNVGSSARKKFQRTTKITDFFPTKPKSTDKKVTSTSNILDDILKTSLEEEEYYADLNRIQEIQSETKREQEEIRLHREQEKKFKLQFTAELASRFQADSSEPKTSFALPHMLVDPEGSLKPIKDSQTFYPLNFNEELKINLAFHKNNSRNTILLDDLSEAKDRKKRSTKDATDFYFFQPQFGQQHYQLSPNALKMLPKNAWYSFLSQVDTPNLLIESGVLLARIRANKSITSPRQPLPLVIWKWIMCNSLRSKLLPTHYQQYRDCLVEGYDSEASMSVLSLTLQSIFMMIGANPEIVMSIFNSTDSDPIDSVQCNIEESFQRVLSPKGHDYLPQAAAIELMIDVAVKILIERKAAPYLVNATFIATALASIDASLLSISRTPFSKNHAVPMLFFGSQISQLLESIPVGKWNDGKGSQSWLALSELLGTIIPAQNYELRNRLLNVLSRVNNDRAKILKISLALRFLVESGPKLNPELVAKTLAEFTQETDLLDINMIVAKVLLPSIDFIFRQCPEKDDEDDVSVQTPVLYRIHYMNHCLHNVNTLNTAMATALVRALELKADSITRLMRVSNPEILLQIGVLGTTVLSLRSRLPAYDVFSAV